VHREDKHVSMHNEPFVPYTGPLLYSLIEQEVENVELSLIEAQRDNLNLNEALKKLDKINPDIVVCLIGWISIPWDRKLAETKYPTIAIILQQWLNQLEAVAQYKLKNKYTLYKEIEAPLVESLIEFQKNGVINNAAGVIIENNGKYNLTSVGNLYDIKKLPLPNFKIFKLEKYFELREKHLPKEMAKVGYLNTMKSCSYKCAFCGQANDGTTRVRYQTASYVVSQLEYLSKEYGIEKFIFIDNLFTLSKRRAKEFCKDLIKSNINIKYSVNDRTGYFDDEILSLLKKSGCYEIRIGIETVESHLQEYLNKKIDIKNAIEQIKLVKKHGIKVQLYFTPGIPGETKKSLRMNAKFISDCDAENFTTGPLFVMPDTQLYNKLKEEGLLYSDKWEDYRNQSELVYRNKTYKNAAEIKESELYMRKRVYLYNMIKINRGFTYIRKNFLFYLFQFKIFRDFIRKSPDYIRSYIEKITDFKR